MVDILLSGTPYCILYSTTFSNFHAIARVFTDKNTEPNNCEILRTTMKVNRALGRDEVTKLRNFDS